MANKLGVFCIAGCRHWSASLRSLPNMLIQVGDDEVLLSDSMRLAQKAKDEGIEVSFEVWKGMWHVFQGFAMMMPEAKRAVENLDKFIKKNFNEL